MTGKELIEILRQFDPDLPVYIVGCGGSWTDDLRPSAIRSLEDDDIPSIADTSGDAIAAGRRVIWLIPITVTIDDGEPMIYAPEEG